MSLIAKKDIDILLSAGFDEADLGISPGSKKGVEIYETPDDYFARELIENACEQGECSLMGDIISHVSDKEPYDNSHKGIYEGIDYPGFYDPTDEVPQHMVEQVKWLQTIKLGKLNIWQRRNKAGDFQYQVSELKVIIPDEEKERMKRIDRESQKILWTTYARGEWKNVWQAAVDSMWEHIIDDTTSIITKSGKEMKLLVISADSLREIGYENLPYEARWITMIYFDKDVYRRW